MSTNHTTNYNLNQWEATDKVLRTEFNEDNAKIDAALKANADAIAAEEEAREAAVAGKGNCQIYMASYEGKSPGTSTVTVQFPWLPTLAVIVGTDGQGAVFTSSQTSIRTNFEYGSNTFTPVWSDTTLSWDSSNYGPSRLNGSGVTYTVIAFRML